MKSFKMLKFISTCLFTILTLGMLSGCGGYQDRWTINAQDPIDRDNLTLNLSVYKASIMTLYDTSFEQNMSISELSGIIDSQDTDAYSLSAKVYQDEYILIEKKADEVTHHYLIRNYSTSEGEKRYGFFASTADIRKNNVRTPVYFPYHLIRNMQSRVIGSSDTGAAIEQTYHSDATTDEFYEFYKNCSGYTVTSNSNDSITVQDQTKSGVKITISFSPGDDLNVRFSIQ